jgi:hypothetical protein
MLTEIECVGDACRAAEGEADAAAVAEEVGPRAAPGRVGLLSLMLCNFHYLSS